MYDVELDSGQISFLRQALVIFFFTQFVLSSLIPLLLNRVNLIIATGHDEALQLTLMTPYSWP